MTNDQAVGLGMLGLGIVIILAGIAASLGPLGLGAAVVGLLIAAGALQRLR